ncbi:tautomerase family protein [Streptomyces spongiae]|uniref:4-oxalocrotonate tautomerase n=1 Tax=Streptomyces spongiae TaxID=565072 RepID=A0A5N8XEQ1_9ACTN|nr:tautomerase family protein [Streptomyces spongiae]MPY58003.1 4-oxalocrotonate tautomerase [Streptomyces spongiae]
MPMIRLTLPSGSLTEESRRTVQRELAAVLLRWEGAPDTAPRFLVDVTVPEGALSERRKAGLVEDATRTVLGAAGLPQADALRVWVLVHQQPDGTWGAGGSVIRYADLVALAKEQRADA